MHSPTYDMELTRGLVYSRVLTLRSGDNSLMDLTGQSARLQVWADEQQPPILTLTTGAGILIDPATGRLEYRVSGAQAQALPMLAGIYRLDLIDPASEASELLRGAVTVAPV
jgi:hypothetical protein